MKKEKTFEEKLKRVEEISEEMDKGEASLDDSMNLYTEAKALINELKKEIEDARQKITLLEINEEGNEKLTDFNIGE